MSVETEFTYKNKTSSQLTPFEIAAMASAFADMVESGHSYNSKGIQKDKYGSISAIDIVQAHMRNKNIPLSVMRVIDSNGQKRKAEMIPYNTSTINYLSDLAD